MIATLLLALFLPGSVRDPLPEKHQRWLQEEVPYIISNREKEEFLALESETHREAFLEYFWQRRDPDPATESNEFQEEHTRRIDYANQHFGNEGKPGWRTERGRIYIIHGPPDDVRYSFGRKVRVTVQRPTSILNPGGGPTPVAEVEIQSPESEAWTYFQVEGSRSVAGVFSVIFAKMRPNPLYEVERWVKRVDPNSDVSQRVERDQTIKGFATRPGLYLTNDYRVIYAGQPRFVDLDELLRSAFHPHTPAVDQFQRHQALADLQRPSGEVLDEKLERRERLRKWVESRIFFGELPVEVGVGYFKFLDGRVHVPVRLGIEVPPEQPAPAIELLVELAKPSGRVVATFSDEIRGQDGRLLSGEISYQSRLVASPGSHVLRVTVADEANQRIGTWTESVNVPDLSSPGFGASDLVLCEQVIPRKDFEKQWGKKKLGRRRGQRESPLAFDDYVFLPAVHDRFRRKQNLTTLVEVYNPSLSAGVPQVEIQSSLRREDGTALDFPVRQLDYLTDKSGNTIIYAFTVPLKQLDPGEYRFTVEITDSPTGQVVRKSVPLRIR